MEEIYIQCVSFSDGIAIGAVYFPQVGADAEIPKFAITADQVDREIERYRKAIALSRLDLEHLECSLNTEGHGEAATIIKAHLEMLSDPFLTVEIEGKVRHEKYNIESVFRSTMHEFATQFPKQADSFFQQRLVDVMDLSNRILSHLRKSPNRHFHDAPKDSIVIASDLDALGAAAAEQTRVLAFVTSKGAAGSHAALIARSRGIPYVGMVDLGHFLKHVGRCAIVDGHKGIVILNPKIETLSNYKQTQTELKICFQTLQDESDQLCETRDKEPLRLYVNVSSMDELDHLHEIKPHGVGLLRSEFLFTHSEKESFEEKAQYDLFSKAVRKMKKDPIVIRLFDFGGDKQFLGQDFHADEKNPLMGCRGIRHLLRRSQFFNQHLRALLRVAKEGDVRLLVPLVSQIEEMKRLKKIIEEMSEALEKEGLPHCPDPKIGCMLEVPAALLLVDKLAPHCDFFSLGTNDLTQYVLGIDRVNPVLEPLYQPLHPSVLRLVRLAILEAKKVDKPISICGEMASQPLFAPLLIGLGLRELSVVPRSLLEVKKQLRHFSLQEAHELAMASLSCEDAEEVFQLCRKFAKQ